MSFKEAIEFVLKTVKNDQEIRKFLPTSGIVLGDRKHGDDLLNYQFTVYPSGEAEPSETRTFDSRGRQFSGTRLRGGATKKAIYRLFITLWCREEDPEVRLLGGPGSPGILEFVRMVKDALENAWNYKPSILALEFESVGYSEGFPPPKAEMVVVIEEEIAVVARRADTFKEVLG